MRVRSRPPVQEPGVPPCLVVVLPRLGLAHDGALRHLRCGDHACGFLAGFIRIEVRDGRRHVPFGLGLCTKDALDDGLCGRRRASNLRSGAHRDAPRFEVLQLVGDGTLVKGRHGRGCEARFWMMNRAMITTPTAVSWWYHPVGAHHVPSKRSS